MWVFLLPLGNRVFTVKSILVTLRHRLLSTGVPPSLSGLELSYRPHHFIYTSRRTIIDAGIDIAIDTMPVDARFISYRKIGIGKLMYLGIRIMAAISDGINKIAMTEDMVATMTTTAAIGAMVIRTKHVI